MPIKDRGEYGNARKQNDLKDHNSSNSNYLRNRQEKTERLIKLLLASTALQNSKGKAEMPSLFKWAIEALNDPK